MKRKSSLSRSSPLRSGGALKRSKIKTVSDKRKKAIAEAAAERKAEKEAGVVHECEISKWLDGVLCWEGYVQAWEGRADRHVVVRHHVNHQRWFDDEWNVLWVCHPFNMFAEAGWHQAAILLGTYALWKAGRFDREESFRCLRKDVIGQIHNWHVDDGLFEDESVLAGYADELLATFPPVQESEMSDVKVFEVEDDEWIAARSLEEAVAYFKEQTGVDPSEEGYAVGEVPADRMERLMFNDEVGRRPFARRLEEVVASGDAIPAWFATGNN